MSELIVPEDRQWECGWDGHLAAQLRRMARLPFSEKLEWLEEAQRLAEYMLNQRSKTINAAPADPAVPQATAARTS